MLFFLSIFLLLTPKVWNIKASNINAGIVEGIWFSDTPPIEGKPTTIFVAIYNQEDVTIKGLISFRVGDNIISAKEFILFPKQISILSAEWTPTQGTKTVTAVIEKAKRCQNPNIVSTCENIQLKSIQLKKEIVVKTGIENVSPHSEVEEKPQYQSNELPETSGYSEVRSYDLQSTERLLDLQTVLDNVDDNKQTKLRVKGPLAGAIQSLTEFDSEIRRRLQMAIDKDPTKSLTSLHYLLLLPGLGIFLILLPLYLLYLLKKKLSQNMEKHHSTNGGGGIRTHGTRKGYSGFQDRPVRPLRHPSIVRKTNRL